MNATLGSGNFRVPTCKQSQLSPQNYNKEEVTRLQPLTLCRVPNMARVRVNYTSLGYLQPHAVRWL